MSNKLKKLQNNFSKAARGHEDEHATAFDQKRLNLYRELLLNNLQETISPCFPVLGAILPKEIWQAILKDIIKHQSITTPIFHELPKVLLNYLKKHPLKDYPFAYELAHYEWVELEVELLEPEPVIPLDESLNMLQQQWKLTRTARLLDYNYEVDKISKDYQPHEKNQTYLMVYQHEADVQFMKLNELSFQLLSMMLQESLSAENIIHSLCDLYPKLNKNDLINACKPLISNLYEEGCIRYIMV